MGVPHWNFNWVETWQLNHRSAISFKWILNSFIILLPFSVVCASLQNLKGMRSWAGGRLGCCKGTSFWSKWESNGLICHLINFFLRSDLLSIRELEHSCIEFLNFWRDKNLSAPSSLTSSSELFLLDVMFFLSRTLDDSELLLRYMLYEQLGFDRSLSVSCIDFALIATSGIELLVEYGKS